MDLITRLGGRKFIMALATIGSAMFLEMHSEKGLTPTMAGFLVGIVGAFSAANYATTAKHMGSKGGGGNVERKLDQIQTQLDAAFSPEAMATLSLLLSNVNDGVAQLKETTGQVARAVVNLSNKRG